jgi:hypothetical protein
VFLFLYFFFAKNAVLVDEFGEIKRIHFKLKRWGVNFLMQTRMKYLPLRQKIVPEPREKK